MTEIRGHINLSFAREYYSLRQKEQRIYSDSELLQLPTIDRDHPYYTEWLARKESADRLRNYLAFRKDLNSLLEIGSGNGWLCNFLSVIHGINILGIDVVSEEISTAKRVFGHRNNIKFIRAEFPSTEDLTTYDVVIMAASLQYFPSIKTLVPAILKILKPDGELHILDTFLYKINELNEAKQRSQHHFSKTGSPEMAAHYFHHCWDELAGFDYRILYKPSRFKQLFYGRSNPFPWICIKKKPGS